MAEAILESGLGIGGDAEGEEEGQQAEVKGVVLELPEGLKIQVKAGNEPIYILADTVRPRA